MFLESAARQVFSGSADFLGDPENRARVAEYLTDVAKSHGHQVDPALFGEGQSYGEMAQELIASIPPEPVDLLILAFASHDMRPNRQTAAYLSHLTPGAPMAFALCDQGSAGAFTALKIALAYARPRTLLVFVEQANLPYSSPIPSPARHQGVAMVLAHQGPARVTGIRQHAGVDPGDVARLAAAEFGAMSTDQAQAGVVLGESLASLWAPEAKQVNTAAGQPMTGVWFGLIDELAEEGLVVVADYDAHLRYLSLAAFSTATSSTA